MTSPIEPGDRPWVIVGAGGHGAAVAEVLAALGATILGFQDSGQDPAPEHLGMPVFRDFPPGHIEGGNPIALAVGDNRQREQLSLELVARGASDVNFPAIAHPSASISQFARIAHGTVVLQGACVGAAAVVGRFCVVATAAVLTHDAVMDDYSFLATSAVLGAASLGPRSFVGAGALVSPGARVGADSVVGAQSHVRGELGDLVVAYGNPAVARRTRRVGEPHLR